MYAQVFYQNSMVGKGIISFFFMAGKYQTKRSVPDF
jgi:hypothetical protein